MLQFVDDYFRHLQNLYGKGSDITLGREDDLAIISATLPDESEKVLSLIVKLCENGCCCTTSLTCEDSTEKSDNIAPEIVASDFKDVMSGINHGTTLMGQFDIILTKMMSNNVSVCVDC